MGWCVSYQVTFTEACTYNIQLTNFGFFAHLLEYIHFRLQTSPAQASKFNLNIEIEYLENQKFRSFFKKLCIGNGPIYRLKERRYIQCRSNLRFVDLGRFCDLILHWKISVLACVGTGGLICFVIGAGMLWLWFIILLLTFFLFRTKMTKSFVSWALYF